VEWEEAGIGPDSRVFGSRVEDRIVAVAGYERWSGQIAQLQVFCHPGYRRCGLAAEPLKAAISEALADRSTDGWLRFSSACLTTQWCGPGLAMLAPAADRGR
jgi:hypothetical protein